MPTWCIVRGCSNSSRKPQCNHLSWHSFPNHDETLLTEWLTRVKRFDEVKGQVNKHWKICSEHFDPRLIEKTLTGRRRLKKGAVPTIFDQKDIKRRRVSVEDERQRLAAVEIAFMSGQDISVTKQDGKESLDSDLSGGSIEVEKLNGLKRVLQELKQAKKSHGTVCETEGATSDQNKPTEPSKTGPSCEIEIPTIHRDYFEAINSFKLENTQLRIQIESEKQMKIEAEKQRELLATENLELKRALEDEVSLRKSAEEEFSKELKKRTKVEQELEAITFNYKSLSKNPKLMHYFSGFNAEEFEIFIDFLGRLTCENLSYEDPGKSLLPDDVHVYHGRKTGRPRRMKPRDQLLMSLCRVRHGFTCQDLGVRFQTSVAQVSRISSSFIALMQKRFADVGLWPEDESTHIHNTQWPDILKPFHQRTRIIIEALRSYLKKAALKFPQHVSMVAQQ
ncbi:hypothetical protein QZH41_002428 [Actinostola sp. cb2023]|nr:hypothetical protein QZH41_002428 [Actinostola sp. cb2023]